MIKVCRDCKHSLNLKYSGWQCEHPKLVTHDLVSGEHMVDAHVQRLRLTKGSCEPSGRLYEPSLLTRTDVEEALRKYLP